MPRVKHVMKARKDNPACQAGESYYWWKFRYGGKHYSLTPPKASQLTQSEFLGQMYDFADRLSELNEEAVVGGAIEEIATEIRDLGCECEEKIQNMPESLQSSPTGEMLQERYDACEAMADELDNIEVPDEFDGPNGSDEPEEPDPVDEPEEPEEPEASEFKDRTEYIGAYEEWESDHAEWVTAKEKYDAYQEALSEYEDAQTEWDDHQNSVLEAMEEASNICYEGP
jgi:hypothetical protein